VHFSVFKSLRMRESLEQGMRQVEELRIASAIAIASLTETAQILQDCIQTSVNCEERNERLVDQLAEAEKCIAELRERIKVSQNEASEARKYIALLEIRGKATRASSGETLSHVRPEYFHYGSQASDSVRTQTLPSSATRQTVSGAATSGFTDPGQSSLITRQTVSGADTSVFTDPGQSGVVTHQTASGAATSVFTEPEKSGMVTRETVSGAATSGFTDPGQSGLVNRQMVSLVDVSVFTDPGKSGEAYCQWPHVSDASIFTDPAESEKAAIKSESWPGGSMRLSKQTWGRKIAHMSLPDPTSDLESSTPWGISPT